MIAGKRQGFTIKPKRFDFEVKRGDYFEYDFEVWTYDSSGIETAVDLSNATIYTSIKKKKGDNRPVATFSQSITGSILTLILTEETSRYMEPGRYYYDVEILYDSKHTTFLEGMLILGQDVTYVHSSLLQRFEIFFNKVLNVKYHPANPIIVIGGGDDNSVLSKLQSFYKVLVPEFVSKYINLSSFYSLTESLNFIKSYALNSFYSINEYDTPIYTIGLGSFYEIEYKD